MFTKTLLSATMLTLLVGTANAQLNTSKPRAVEMTSAAQPANTPVAAAPAAAPQVLSAEAPTAEPVNPFSGKSLDIEGRQRNLEISKMETALLEERLKQAGLAEDMKTLPLKKQVEAAQATTARMKEELSQKESGKLVAIASAPAPKPVVEAAPKRPTKKVLEAAKAAEVPAARMTPQVELTSVLSLSGIRSAVMEFDGSILTVRQGDTTPLGTVDIVDGQSVRIAGRTYRVHGSTLARLTISDPKPVDPLKPTAQQIVAGPMAPASFPGAANGTRPPVLPPLQLPAGVTLLPPAGK